MEIAQVGDIDHIVATPGNIRVVETKWGPALKKKFPGVLGWIAANMKAVREWAAPGIAFMAAGGWLRIAKI